MISNSFNDVEYMIPSKSNVRLSKDSDDGTQNDGNFLMDTNVEMKIDDDVMLMR